MIAHSEAFILELKSKEALSEYIQWIGSDKQKFSELMEFFFSEKLRINQRASWPVGIIGFDQPDLIRPYLKRMLDNLSKAPHQAVRRNTVRVFQEIDLPEDLMGQAYETCFAFLNDPNEPVAIRVFSMSVCHRIAKTWPELNDELRQAIELYLPHGTAGFKSRAKRILKDLS